MMTSPTRPIACESDDIMLRRAEIVQDVFGGDRLAADARLGERHVFRDGRIEVMAHHEHVQMLGERVHRERARRVGGRGQHVRFAAHLDDVGCVAAACAFRVEAVNGAPLEGAIVSSTKPDSFSVSVWIATCTSI